MEVQIEKTACDNREYRYVKLENELECLLVFDPDTPKSAASMDVGKFKYFSNRFNFFM